ncbi:MAG: TatD family hydrolase [Anaerolineaceae bacterium]|nr:TatD family hydrolase [Anaerolineaceae bacterium]
MAPSIEQDHKSDVMTVQGWMPVKEMGISLTHEHIITDGSVWFEEPDEKNHHLRDVPVDKSLYTELRVNAHVNIDNNSMQDVDVAVEELKHFRELGGRTVCEVSCKNIGPFPQKLLKISQTSDVNIIMPTGFYYQASHPQRVKNMNIQQLADEMIQDIRVGMNGTSIKAGLIGEIGITPDFTPEEIKCLRAAVQAGHETQTPVTIHQPSFERKANRVIDIIREEKGDLEHIIIGHMCASGEDFPYQVNVLLNGVFIAYDLIGSDLYYPSIQRGQPTDEENARNIKRLIDAGFIDQILISHDIFIKICLKHYGGRGYGHILENFVPRLKQLGITEEEIHTILVKNPARVFTY